MRLDRLRAFALGLPHATVVKQWGENLVFKIGGKMFLIVSLDGETIDGYAFKCTREDYERLIDIDGIIPARYNLFKSQWVQLEDPDALAGAQLAKQIRTAYDLIRAGLPKKVRATLD